ncbi:MAG: anthranilate phosphoribosyltransferase [Endozoicomonadaceae bacterium]|nr:anthranilate phosphoribosyltransferase [Endozoicomonadaceae bacterium]MCY4329328.1 anthranilate phosphoribosyltransferase [Endozoicomonadaceae bacterium]
MQEGLLQLLHKKNFSTEIMEKIMWEMMTGQVPPVRIAAFLTGMHMKGETVDEIIAAAKVMRSLRTCVQIDDPDIIDVVGTGGDGANLFNVSTASAFICAAAGAKVAKHGNVSFSSQSGSANLLMEAGVNIKLNAEQVKQCIEELNIGFMFAPCYHSAMRHVGEVRKLLGFRTFMNLLGPLTNPANARRHLIGVYEKSLCRVVAEVLTKLGSCHVMVVHSEDGLDEISPVKKTFVVESHNGHIRDYMLDPADYGIQHTDLQGLIVNSPTTSLTLVQQALTGGHQKAADMLMLNAGAALYVAGTAASLKEGINLAKEVVHSGSAATLLQKLAKLSQQLGSLPEQENKK